MHVSFTSLFSKMNSYPSLVYNMIIRGYFTSCCGEPMYPGWSPIHLWDSDVQNVLAAASEITDIIRLVNLYKLYML